MADATDAGATGLDGWLRWITGGGWLTVLPAGLREPAARGLLQIVAAAAVLFLFAPLADSHGDAYLEATFARTLAALAATRGLDSAISLAQSSEVSFSFGPGGSIGIGQALDPVNDLVEQYGSLLLTSTMALGVQRLGMQVGRALGWWLFVPAFVPLAAAAGCGARSRASLMGWSRRLFGVALFARLALPTAGWIDSWVAERFLETGYQQAAAAVSATTETIEQVEEPGTSGTTRSMRSATRRGGSTSRWPRWGSRSSIWRSISRSRRSCCPWERSGSCRVSSVRFFGRADRLARGAERGRQAGRPRKTVRFLQSVGPHSGPSRQQHPRQVLENLVFVTEIGGGRKTGLRPRASPLHAGLVNVIYPS